MSRDWKEEREEEPYRQREQQVQRPWGKSTLGEVLKTAGAAVVGVEDVGVKDWK